MESFALLESGAWLPYIALGGLEVAVRVPRIPSSIEGSFEVTMMKDCHTLYGPFPYSPSISRVLPKGAVLMFNRLISYPSTDVFLRLQPNELDPPTPAI
jgi:hypothetical protein